MTEASQSGSDLEIGKTAILEIVREVARSQKVDVHQLVFEWKLDSGRSQWLLWVSSGKKRVVLRIEGLDIAAWPTSHETAGKYMVKIIHIMEIMRRSQRREAGLDDETVETGR